MPMMAHNLLEAIRLLTNVSRVFADTCIDGIEANVEQCRAYAESSPSIGPSLNPYIGYENATRIAKIALESGRGVLELVREEKLLDDATLADILRPENMIAPRLVPLKA